MNEKNTKATETVEIDPGMSVMPEGPGLMDVPTVIPELGLAAQALASQVSFAKKTWKDGSGGGTPVTAVELNRLEQGVADLTAAVNALRDSVSHIDPAIHIKYIYVASSGKTVHIKGTGWQSYLVFGQSGTLSIVDDRGAGDPLVTKVSGATITANKVDGNGSIDLNAQANSLTLVVVSYSAFALSVS